MVKIQKLFFSFRERPIIKNFSLSIDAGELVQLKGANGAGKTTLIRILAGLLTPGSGSVGFFGPEGKTKQRRQMLEYLPSEANCLYGKMSAMENLQFWVRLRRGQVSDSEILSELKNWNLDHPLVRQHLNVEKFSTGMKRRLALARVSLSTAPFWLLDEPLYGLDDAGMKRFREMLDNHCRSGKACLLVSHESSSFADLQPRVVQLV